MSHLVPRCLRQRSFTPVILARYYSQQTKKSNDKKKKKGPAAFGGLAKRQGRNMIFRALPVTQLTAQVFQKRSVDIDAPSFCPKGIKMTSVGTTMLFKPTNDFFNAYGLPRNLLLEFRILSKPCSVVREVTLKALNTLDIASKNDSNASRIVLTGDAGCGKSFLLLQSVSYALDTGWIVLYIPRAISLLNSSTAYQYDLRTQTYHQPEFAKEILRRFLSVNERALQLIHTQDTLRIEKVRAFDIGTPLIQIIETGVNDASVAPDILGVVLDQLGRQTQHPVLLAVDDFQALYSTSEYRGPDFNRIQSHHLSIPRLLLEYAGGLKSFSRGAFLGAISETNTTYRVPTILRDALGLEPADATDAYAKRSAALASYTEGLREFAVPPQLSVNEAAALFEVWMRDLALHTEANDELFLEKYTESSGNARHFVWKGLLGTLQS